MIFLGYCNVKFSRLTTRSFSLLEFHRERARVRAHARFPSKIMRRDGHARGHVHDESLMLNTLLLKILQQRIQIRNTLIANHQFPFAFCAMLNHHR